MAPRRYVSRLKKPARQLRRRMTAAETIVWARLRRKQIANVQFYRQRPIDRFIVDFYAPSAGLVIEIDGPHHGNEAQAIRDHERSAWLTAQGFRVLRFTNGDVSERLEQVVERIHVAILESSL